MNYGRAHKAIPSKTLSSGVGSGTAAAAAGGASINTQGIETWLDTINTTLRAAGADADSYYPDSLVRSLTVLSGEVLFVEKLERFNDLTNNGQVIIAATGALMIFGNLRNSGTVKIHNGGRLIT